MSDHLIEIKNLKKSFDTLTVLNGISININEGENFIVFGQSGTGKSVLLKCIVGLLVPDSGNIEVDGKSILSLNSKELNDFRKSIGFLFQGSAYIDGG